MLVLTRKVNETIRIGDSVTVVIAEIRDGKVRLGIDAPKSVSVARSDAKSVVPKFNSVRLANNKIVEIKYDLKLRKYRAYYVDYAATRGGLKLRKTAVGRVDANGNLFDSLKDATNAIFEAIETRFEIFSGAQLLK